MKRYKFLVLPIIVIALMILESCGPMIISSRPDVPPPSWLYPNRVEVVRYVYFPDYNIYYDISFRNYIYFENSVWITVDVLPTRYQYINLNRSRYVRIRDYRGDNIRSYHSTNRYYNRGRYDRSRSRNTTTRNRNTTTRSRSNQSNTSTRSRSTRSRDSIK